MVKCQNKFWIENLNELICSFRVIPQQTMSLEEQMNCLTRLVLFIFIIFLLVGMDNSVIFGTFSLLFIIILYYTQKNRMMNVENFKNFGVPSVQTIKNQVNDAIITYGKMSLPIDKQLNFCRDGRLLREDQTYVSANQNMVGGANPKTKIAPVVVAPPAAIEHRDRNSLTVPRCINEETQQDMYQSGYIVSDCCKMKGCTPIEECKSENYGTIIEGFQMKREDSGVSRQRYVDNSHCSSTLFPSYDTVRKEKVAKLPEPGDVDVNCGYNPVNLKHNIPINFPSGNCQQSDYLNEYNKNLFTQIIEPGIYMESQITEPISSNIGISFTQQFEPQTIQKDKHGGLTYVNHAPRWYTPVPEKEENQWENEAVNSNVYDPRLSGYGTSYRSYIEPTVGQPRFYYDDVDVVRRPNFIIRSNVDHLTGAEHYGPMKSLSDTYNDNLNSRAQANDAYMKGTTFQRQDLESRLMHKNSVNAWQKKIAPKRTTSSRMKSFN